MSFPKGSPPSYTPQTHDREEKIKNSSFWDYFRSFPIVEAISDNVINVYGGVKSTPVVGIGLRIVEGSCQSVLEEMKPYTNSAPVKFLDDVACGFLHAAENNFEIVTKTPKEIGNDIRSTVNSGVEVFVQSFAGQFVLSGMELAVSASESVLNVIDPVDEMNEEPDETDGETTPGGRQTTIDELWGLKNCVLKRIYKWLSNFDGTLDPEKRKEIEARRKLTARRHYSNSLARRILNIVPPIKFLLTMVGLIDEHLQISKLLHLTGKESVDNSPVKTANDRGTKRDYSECNSDALDFDEENYKSSEDEDYVQPSNADSTDSEEYNEGETESDIEAQLKDEQNSYSVPTSTKRSTKTSKTIAEANATKMETSSTSIRKPDIQSILPLVKEIPKAPTPKVQIQPNTTVPIVP